MSQTESESVVDKKVLNKHMKFITFSYWWINDLLEKSVIDQTTYDAVFSHMQYMSDYDQQIPLYSPFVKQNIRLQKIFMKNKSKNPMVDSILMAANTVRLLHEEPKAKREKKVVLDENGEPVKSTRKAKEVVLDENGEPVKQKRAPRKPKQPTTEIVQEEIPTEIVQEEIPTEIVQEEIPTEIVEEEIPTEIVEEEPTKVIEEPTKKKKTHQKSKQEPVVEPVVEKKKKTTKKEVKEPKTKKESNEKKNTHPNKFVSVSTPEEEKEDEDEIETSEIMIHEKKYLISNDFTLYDFHDFTVVGTYIKESDSIVAV